jgi:hypothetical protein
MPMDLSKEAMIAFFHLQFNKLEGSNQDQRAEMSNELFTYILTYFHRFIENFQNDYRFLVTVYFKCSEFLTSEKVYNNYKKLYLNSIQLQIKLYGKIEWGSHHVLEYIQHHFGHLFENIEGENEGEGLVG